MSRTALACLLLPLFLIGCSGQSRDYKDASSRFLGPLPGTTYEYTEPDGLRMEVAGIAWVEEGTAVRVRETAFFPPEARPPEFEGKASERKYVYRAQGSRLIMDVAGKQIIMADFSGGKWTLPVMTTSFSGDGATGPKESDWVTLEAQCRMSEHSERVLFGASREVFTVDCSLVMDQNGGEAVQAADLDLAEGIGLIRFGLMKLTAIHKE